MKKENDEITDLFRTRLADAGMNVRDGFWEELSQEIPVACQQRRRLLLFRVAAAASVLLVLAASSATFLYLSPKEEMEEAFTKIAVANGGQLDGDGIRVNQLPLPVEPVLPKPAPKSYGMLSQYTEEDSLSITFSMSFSFSATTSIGNGNRYGNQGHNTKSEQTANRKVAENFSGFKNLKIIYCNGKDVFDSMNAMTEAREYAITTRNPVIVQANCVRIGSHSNSDKHTLYRDENELEYVKEADPLMKFRRMLLRYKRLTEEELLQIETDAKKELSAANRKALSAPDPDPKSIYDFVIPEPYQPQKYKEGIHQAEGEKTFMVNAINETLKAEFRHNPDTFIWGQDVANKEKGGVFNVTKGMQQEFGDARVFSAPIAEDYIVGTANGMSRFDPKIHVVIEGAEFADYFWPAVEQYVECTHEYWRSNGKFAPNITLRLASGGYIGGGLYHSQNIEGALTTLPGARIVCPSFADDAAGLLRTSMRSKGFTLFLEPKALYNSVEAAAVVPEDFEVPFGKARIRREGTDLSIITYGNTTHFCLHAAERLEKEGGWKVEVIDIRSLIPLDKEAIFESVKKTSKALVVHEDKVFSGFGAELAAMIGGEMFRYLDGPVERVGSTFTPVGFNPILEKEILPDEAKIYEAAKNLLEY